MLAAAYRQGQGLAMNPKLMLVYIIAPYDYFSRPDGGYFNHDTRYTDTGMKV